MTWYGPSSSRHGRERKGPVAGVKGWTDPGRGSLLIPAPGRDAQNRMQAEGGRQGPSHATAPDGFPHLPLGSAPGRALSSDGAGEGLCPACLAPPVQLQVPLAAPARTIQKVKSSPLEPVVAQLLLQC